ncbi:MAG: LysM peptidoglycan-binding domain-containing protein [Gemmatimonadaceae bacterium]
MRENEGLYRAVRVVKRTVIGVAVMAVAVVVLGYLFLVRQVDRKAAWADAARELDGSILHYGERAERTARVYRRRGTDYFREANGLLVATPERLIFVGIEPRDKLAGEDAPASITTAEFPNDTLLSVVPGRVYGVTAQGITLQRDGRVDKFAAAPGYESELDSLASYVERRHAAEHHVAAENRALHAAVAQLEKRPLRYEVTRGDALSTIATRFGATPAQIRAWNNMSSDKVRIRDTLTVKPAG